MLAHVHACRACCTWRRAEPGNLQVGFGLKGDLWAIAQALPDGANCIAVVQPALEVKLLHAHLLRRGLARKVRRGS